MGEMGTMAEFPAIRLAGNSGSFSFIDFTESSYGFTRLDERRQVTMATGVDAYMVAWQNELIGVVVN